ncbi:MAG TPA: rod shape-determining protein MreC [Polyangia bacterium]|nr:rod shape-determining protein MreC [Polyangia bacterium]
MNTLRQKIREALIVAGTILVALLVLRQSSRNPGEVSTLDRGILTVITPAQSLLSSVARGIGGFAGRYMDLVHVRAENESLRSDNSRLRAELFEAKRAAAESLRYQRMLGLRDAVSAETLVARVVAIDASPYFRVARVQLDRGEGMVKRGMPVLTPEGVVGRVNRVAGDSSDILLSVDPRSAIDVIIPRTGGRGILKGKPGENGYRAAVEYLMHGEQAKQGDVVVTTGLGGFPRDVPVGKVSRVVKSPAGLYQEVEVTPDVDFARLSEVLVVVAPAPTPDPEVGKKALAPSRGLAVYK